MNNRINHETIQENEQKKTKAISVTLSRNCLAELQKEMERLELKNRSFVVEMILNNYFSLPISEDDL